MFLPNITKSISWGEESIVSLPSSPGVTRTTPEIGNKKTEKINTYYKKKECLILEGERANRAIFFNFSPPMGDNLSPASKGQMLIESDTPRCSFRKGSLHQKIIVLYHSPSVSFFLNNPQVLCFADQKKKITKVISTTTTQLELS